MSVISHKLSMAPQRSEERNDTYNIVFNYPYIPARQHTQSHLIETTDLLRVSNVQYVTLSLEI